VSAGKNFGLLRYFVDISTFLDDRSTFAPVLLRLESYLRHRANRQTKATGCIFYLLKNKVDNKKLSEHK